YDPTNSGLPDYHIKSIAKDANDTMWIGTSWGLAKWDGADYWYTYTELNSEILVPNINALYIDSNDVVYIGTLNGGLNVYDHGVFTIYRTANSTISDNTILSIDEDIYHNKWLATSFGGLSVFTEAGDFLKFTPLTSDISDWSVDAVRLDNNNLGVIGMSATGLEIFNNISWTHYTTANSDLPDDFINALAIDSANIIWIGTEEGGLVKFDRSAVAVNTIGQVEVLTYPNPATDNALIIGLPENLSVQIYNNQGMLCGIAEYRNGMHIVNAAKLSAGTYWIYAVDHHTTYTASLQVVH
ncbi:MAG TPA: two-component regulator propeller domain-containing protein, partial [Chitinophagales bacterium]|nr:two-component regulator propeller domain-containing protein [Chitinophagales bacterium]